MHLSEDVAAFSGGLMASFCGTQISCIPGGRFIGEVFSRQRHAPAFHLQLTEISEHWPALAIAVPNAEPPFYEFWQTVNVPLVVRNNL